MLITINVVPGRARASTLLTEDYLFRLSRCADHHDDGLLLAHCIAGRTGDLPAQRGKSLAGLLSKVVSRDIEPAGDEVGSHRKPHLSKTDHTDPHHVATPTLITLLGPTRSP